MPGGLISWWLIPSGLVSGWCCFPLDCMPSGLVSGWFCFPLDSMPSGLASEWFCFPLDFVVCHPGGWCAACGSLWEVSRCSRSRDSLRKSLVPRWGCSGSPGRIGTFSGRIGTFPPGSAWGLGVTLLFSCRLGLAVPSRWQASSQHSCYPPHGVGIATRKTSLASLPVANPDQLHLESLGPQIEVPAEVHTRKQEKS